MQSTYRMLDKRMKRMLILVFFLAFISAIGGAGIGFWIADQRSEANSLLSRIERKALAYTRSAFASEKPLETTIKTNRLTLDKSVFNVPLMVTDSGGGISESPDGGLLLIDRIGNIFYHIDGQTTKLQIETPDNGLNELVSQYEAGEFGGKSFRARGFRFNDILALDGGETVELLISYSDWKPDRFCYRNVLAHVSLQRWGDEIDWSVARGDWRELKVTEPCLPPLANGGTAIQGIEAGGRLVAVSESEVVWSSGAYEHDDFFKESEIEPYAQRDDSDYGRLLKINVHSGKTKVLAKGLRNPQGLARADDGRIFVTDHGMRGGDELNVVGTGSSEYNFGWPFVSYGTHYNGRPVDASGRHAGHSGYHLPLVSFVPSVAPGAVVYVDDFHPVWDGDILVGTFRGSIERVHEVKGRAIFVESIEIGVRVRDLVLSGEGEIVIWTDNLQLIFLKPSTSPSPTERVFAAIDEISSAPRRQAVTNLMESCLQCHGLAEGEIRAGPSLHGLCGARMGSSSEFDQYSDALSSSRLTWDEELLSDFIREPESVVPGTTMAWEGTVDTESSGIVASLICSISR